MTQAKIRIMPGARSGIASAPTYNGPQASAATFKQGAPVKNSSGNLAAVSVTTSQGASSALTVVNKSSTSNLIGISEGLAVASSTGNLVVRRVMEGQAFIGNLVNGSASSAKVSKIGGTVVLALVTGETHWGWANDASSTFSNYASLVKGKIIDLIDAASTVNGRVAVEITKGGALIT